MASDALIWMGQLYDGRVVLETEPLPEDAPRVEVEVSGVTRQSVWKHAWQCTIRNRRHTCGAPDGVACRCKEWFHGL